MPSTDSTLERVLERRRFSYWNGVNYELHDRFEYDKEDDRWLGYTTEALDAVTWVIEGTITDNVVMFPEPL